MLVVDVSPSMAEPLGAGVSRLEAVRGEVRRFLQGRDGDAVGLVLFGGDALVRVPPLADRRPLEAALDAARVGELGEGTSLGTALGLAADRLRAIDSPSRVAVVFTDGEDNAGSLDPLTAAAAAAALGQRVHVVDASTDAAARILLAGIAERGGGGHHAVGDPEGMVAALAALTAMEPGRFAGPLTAGRAPAWDVFLWVAMALLMAEAGVRASRWGVIP
jgi:Ca-activated chloride channel family protein